MTKRKPLWWRVGKGKWHKDPLVYLDRKGAPMHEGRIRDLLNGAGPLLRLCSGEAGPCANEPELKTRRSAPPVADQCKGCRAAKAKAKEVRA